MHKTLYIVGNGFDLFHGLKSSYCDFGEYLSKHAPNIFADVEKYLMADEGLWAVFEENLAHLDTEILLEEASQFLVGYGAEGWSDSFHHDYQVEIESVVKSLSTDLFEWFTKWVRQIEIPSHSISRRLFLNNEAMFLNFNYTPTLSRLYNITEDQIVYLHGCSSSKESRLVLGHAWTTEAKAIDPHQDVEDIDTRIQEGDELIERYFKNTFKATDKIISSNDSFFKSLTSLREINVLGHSVSDVDLPYYFEILKYIDVNKVIWNVTYHADVLSIESQIEKLGIASDLVKYIRMESLARE